jgi:hypothetical protein
MPDTRPDKMYAALMRARKAVVDAGDVALENGYRSMESDLFAIGQELYRLTADIYDRSSSRQLRIRLSARGDGGGGGESTDSGQAPGRPSRQRPR